MPCHNEEASIDDVISSIPKIAEIAEIIVVDNNSTDNTKAAAIRAGARVVEEPLKGYGRALKTGFSHSTGDVIVALDGDGQYLGEIIPALVQYLENNKLDFVSGNRFPLTNRNSTSILRILGNKLLTLAINLLFGLRLSDSQSGPWASRKAILNEIQLENNDMAISEEIKIKIAISKKFKFAEYHVPCFPAKSRSKLSIVKHGLGNALYLLKLYFRRVHG